MHIKITAIIGIQPDSFCAYSRELHEQDFHARARAKSDRAQARARDRPQVYACAPANFDHAI